MKRITYEVLFILDSNHYARDPGGVGGSIAKMAEELGATVLVSRLWAEQKLAYSVEGHNKGTYWLAYFEMDTDRLTEFSRACQLNEAVLRHMALKLDKRLVEPMIAHAKGESVAPTEEAESAEATAT